jgi:integrase
VCSLAAPVARMQPALAALATSFGKSELLALTSCDIDWRCGMITVQVASLRGRETKTMPMTERLTALLKGLRVPSNAGCIFGYRCSNKSFRRATHRADLPDGCFRDLHHIGTRLVQDGLDVSQVLSVLGHKTITMTMCSPLDRWENGRLSRS